MPTPPRQRSGHWRHVAAAMPVPGRRIADIGCGGGALVGRLVENGAEAWGIDPGRHAITAARSRVPAGRFVVAGGEALPLATASFDAAIFFNSLHHVPIGLMAAALAEAARIVRPGGVLYVMEPIAGGPRFELTRLVDDETEVRAAAYRALQDFAAVDGVQQAEAFEYDAPVVEKSFDGFVAGMIAVAPERSDRMAALEPELRQRYDALAERTEKGDRFDQPSRVIWYRVGANADDA